MECSQNLVSSLTQTKFYKSQSQYFPTDNIPPLESEASLLDFIQQGKMLNSNEKHWNMGKKEPANS